jgi:hypothetical protein
VRFEKPIHQPEVNLSISKKSVTIYVEILKNYYEETIRIFKYVEAAYFQNMNNDN